VGAVGEDDDRDALAARDVLGLAGPAGVALQVDVVEVDAADVEHGLGPAAVPAPLRPVHGGTLRAAVRDVRDENGEAF
jgi:hypothetical protein